MQYWECMKRTWGGLGLQRKIVLLYLTTSILPIVLISLLAFCFYYQGMLKEVLTFVQESSDGHEIIVNERLENYSEKMYEIVTDSNIIKISETVNSCDSNESFSGRWKLYEELGKYISSLQKIRSLTFIAENDEYVSVFQGVGSVTDIVFSKVAVRDDIYEKVAESGKMTYITGINLAAGGNRSDYVILLGIPVHNLYTEEKTGIMVMALDDSILNFNNQGSNAVGNNRRTGVTTLITDKNDVILAAEQERYIGSDYQDYLASEFPNKKNLHELRSSFSIMDCQAVNVVDMDMYLQNIYSLAKAIVAISVGITLVFFLLLYVISGRYIRTVKKIAKGIEAYSGTPGENLRVDIDDGDELHLIAWQFNKMIQRVNHLVFTLQEKNEEIKEILARQKHAEIKALEAQINPHFLFNTLDAINWRAIEHDEEEISNMLCSLGSLLRYSVSNIESIVILEAEIAWLRKYIYLQRERFNYSFSCTFDIEQESLGFPVYKMLLQPLIENVIVHGFEGVKKDGMIFVQSYLREDGKLCIRIQDNGIGIPEDELAVIQEEISRGASLNNKKIGISNAANRLKIYYHGEAELKILSKYGEGTEVIMVIPPLEAEGDK